MLPEKPEIFGAPLVPALVARYEAGVEGVDLGGRDYLGGPMRTVGPYDVDHERCLKNRQVVGDRSAADGLRVASK